MSATRRRARAKTLINNDFQDFRFFNFFGGPRDFLSSFSNSCCSRAPRTLMRDLHHPSTTPARHPPPPPQHRPPTLSTTHPVSVVTRGPFQKTFFIYRLRFCFLLVVVTPTEGRRRRRKRSQSAAARVTLVTHTHTLLHTPCRRPPSHAMHTHGLLGPVAAQTVTTAQQQSCSRKKTFLIAKRARAVSS